MDDDFRPFLPLLVISCPLFLLWTWFWGWGDGTSRSNVSPFEYSETSGPLDKSSRKHNVPVSIHPCNYVSTITYIIMNIDRDVTMQGLGKFILGARGPRKIVRGRPIAPAKNRRYARWAESVPAAMSMVRLDVAWIDESPWRVIASAPGVFELGQVDPLKLWVPLPEHKIFINLCTLEYTVPTDILDVGGGFCCKDFTNFTFSVNILLCNLAPKKD